MIIVYVYLTRSLLVAMNLPLVNISEKRCLSLQCVCICFNTLFISEVIYSLH